MPSTMPAMIDSHGKPGIAGRTMGVETEVVVTVLVPGVLTTVIVDTAVLTTVADGELVAVTAVEEVSLELVPEPDPEPDPVAVALAVDVVLEVELDVELELGVEVAVDDALEVVACCCPTTGGTAGSRWKIPVNAVGTAVAVAQVVPALGCAPTAHPSVGFVVKTEKRPSPQETGVGMFIPVHPAPFHQAVTSFAVAGHVMGAVALTAVRGMLHPTAHPSPLPAVVPKVSTCTDVHAAVAGALAAVPRAQTPPLLFVVMIVLWSPTIHP